MLPFPQPLRRYLYVLEKANSTRIPRRGFYCCPRRRGFCYTIRCNLNGKRRSGPDPAGSRSASLQPGRTPSARPSAHLQRRQGDAGRNAHGWIGRRVHLHQRIRRSCRTSPSAPGLKPQHFPRASPPIRPRRLLPFCYIKGATPVTKVIEGPFPPFKIFDQGLQGQGLRRAGSEGFPRFEKCNFRGEFPFAEVRFADSCNSSRRVAGCLESLHSSGRQELRHPLRDP